MLARVRSATDRGPARRSLPRQRRRLSLGVRLMPVTLLTALATADGQCPDSGLAGWIVDLMDKLGLVRRGAAVSLDNYPAVPAERDHPAARRASRPASRATFSLAGALIATTVGSVFGAWSSIGSARSSVVDRTRRLGLRQDAAAQGQRPRKGGGLVRQAWRQGGVLRTDGADLPQPHLDPGGRGADELRPRSLFYHGGQCDLEHDLRRRRLSARRSNWESVEPYASLVPEGRHRLVLW